MKTMHLLFVLVAAAIFVAALCATFGPRKVLTSVLEPFKNYAERMFVLGIRPSPKAVLVIAPVSKTNGATASASFDTLGYDHLTLDVFLPTADTTTDQPSVLKLSESDDTTTTVTDIAAFTGGTQTSATVGFVIPAGKTTAAANSLIKMNVDLKKRKRYLTLTIVPRTTQIVGAVANLQIAEQEPTQASDAGVDTLVSG
jgi:hypothetical protein